MAKLQPKQKLSAAVASVLFDLRNLPGCVLAFEADIQTVSEANGRGSWLKAWRRKQAQQLALKVAWREKAARCSVTFPCTIYLHRIGPQVLDSDNLIGGCFKAVRDQIAREIGIDDGSDLVRFEYGQTAIGARQYAIVVGVLSGLEWPRESKAVEPQREIGG